MLGHSGSQSQSYQLCDVCCMFFLMCTAWRTHLLLRAVLACCAPVHARLGPAAVSAGSDCCAGAASSVHAVHVSYDLSLLCSRLLLQ